MHNLAKHVNAGPDNVDAKLLEHWPKCDVVNFSKCEGWKRAPEIISEVAASDCVIAEGIGRSSIFAQKLCRILGRRIIGITHGWWPYENEVNHLGHSELEMIRYRKFMQRCDAIAAVSKMQAEFDVAQMPELSGKTYWFFNGVERRPPIKHIRTGHLVVSVSGGTRPIKRNQTVSQACGLIAASGYNVELRVYGRNDVGNQSWLLCPWVHYMGQVSQDEFFAGLLETDVFVQASMHESFGLSAIDALQAGASILLSDSCGVSDILAVEDRDLVSTDVTYDVLAENIWELYQEPNAERLAASIDYETYSWDAAAKRLHAICAGQMDKGF